MLNIDGILFRLNQDTAGFRVQTYDVIERIGMGKSLEMMAMEDIVVYMFDVNDEVEEVLRRKRELEAGGAPNATVISTTIPNPAARSAVPLGRQ